MFDFLRVWLGIGLGLDWVRVGLGKTIWGVKTEMSELGHITIIKYTFCSYLCKCRFIKYK